jgi:outer membrane protein W
LFSQDKIGHFSVGIQSGILMPFADNKGLASEKVGISNGLTLKYFPSEHFSMGMSLSLINNHFQGQGEANGVPITQVPFTFDFNWYPTDGLLKPYIGVGAGLSFFTVTPVNGLVNTLKEIPDTYTTPGYLLSGKAGLLYRISNLFSIYTEGIFYQVIEPGESFLWQQSDGTLYRQFSKKASFSLGLLYHFKQ